MTLRVQIDGPAGKMLANYRQRLAVSTAGAIALPMPEESEPIANQLANGLVRAWQWIAEKRRAQLESKHLRVTETVSLGEKRFVALVQVEGRQFLIGGGPTGVSLLAHLTPESSDSQFPDILRQQLKSGNESR